MSPTFALWHLRRAPKDAAVLADILAPGGAGVRRVRSYHEWTESEADVLVLRGTDDAGLPDPDGFASRFDLRDLEGRRVLGVGSEAGRAFEAMGLEIGAGRTCTFESARPEVVLEPVARRRLGLPARLLACEPPLRASGRRRWSCEALHVPRGVDPGPVEVLARCASDSDYAPLAREMNYVYCGVASDARRFTDGFREALRAVAHDLAVSHPRPFALAEWPLSGSGEYAIDVPSGGSGSARPSQRTFFFRFEKPAWFSAELRPSGSKALVLTWSPDFAPFGSACVQGGEGDVLRVVHPVLSAEIGENRGRYWRLEVANLDASPARGRLRVDVVREGALECGPGLRVALDHPPRDAATVARIASLLDDPDSAIASRAEAALVAIGRPAKKAVEAVLQRALASSPFGRRVERLEDPSQVDRLFEGIVEAMREPRVARLAGVLARIRA